MNHDTVENIAHAAPQDQTGLMPAVALTSSLAACGGGNDEASPTNAQALRAPESDELNTYERRKSAGRFLGHAALAITDEHIQQIVAVPDLKQGYANWISDQAGPVLAEPDDRLLSRRYWLKRSNLNAPIAGWGFDNVMWRKLIDSPDTLRQRITIALSEILVLSIDGLQLQLKQYHAAGYFDLLEKYAFGKYKDLLYDISLNPAMGSYLSFRGNRKVDPQLAASPVPDENYARELMQLYTIGLYMLNMDGTLKLGTDGLPIETYDQKDITELARVFTGLDYYVPGDPEPDDIPEVMTFYPARHDNLAKTLTLGLPNPIKIPKRPPTQGLQDIRDVVHHLVEHPNTAPFVSKQLIQRLVTSNPRPEYVQRVATVFWNMRNDDKQLLHVMTAILTDDDAVTYSGSYVTPHLGKLREPMLRFIAWARTFHLTDSSVWEEYQWDFGNLGDPTLLGQSPGRSPSVFNFFRPGYVPPPLTPPVLDDDVVAPEFQIVGEASVVAYVNFMQMAVSMGVPNKLGEYKAKANYSHPEEDILSIAKTKPPKDLVRRLDLLLTAHQLTPDTIREIETAIADLANEQRLYAALTLVLASPDFIVQA